VKVNVAIEWTTIQFGKTIDIALQDMTIAIKLTNDGAIVIAYRDVDIR
jgi:hypothetical protein